MLLFIENELTRYHFHIFFIRFIIIINIFEFSESNSVRISKENHETYSTTESEALGIIFIIYMSKAGLSNPRPAGPMRAQDG